MYHHVQAQVTNAVLKVGAVAQRVGDVAKQVGKELAIQGAIFAATEGLGEIAEVGRLIEAGGELADGGRAASQTSGASASNVVESVEKIGAKWKVHPTAGNAGEGVAIDFGDGTKIDVRVETHEPHGHHGNVQRWENGVEVQNTHVKPKDP